MAVLASEICVINAVAFVRNVTVSEILEMGAPTFDP